MKTALYWSSSLLILITLFLQTHPYIFGITLILFFWRLIYEISKFPSEDVIFIYLGHAKKIYTKEVQFLAQQKSLTELELNKVKDLNNDLSKNQRTTIIQSEEKLVEAEFLTKKLIYQKQMFHFIGHDLKAPFQNIISFLTKTKSDEGNFNFIKRNAEHGLNLINEILETKQEGTFHRPNGKNLYLDSLVRDIIHQFDLADFCKVEYCDLVDKIPLDKNKGRQTLGQTLSNLLSNSKKYALGNSSTKKMNIFLKFSLGNYPGILRLDFYDNGPGINAEQKKLLFNSPVKKTERGHGRGLYQLKLFLNDYGGEIRLKKGTKKAHFEVELPLLSTKTDEHLISKTKEKPVSPSKKINILIIDDSIDIHQILGLYLEELAENIEIHSATNLKEAIELESKFDYDLCFLDMNLKNITGEDVYRQLNKIKNDSIVIAISASFEEEQVDRLNKLGIKKTMTKSFNEKELNKLIKELQY